MIAPQHANDDDRCAEDYPAHNESNAYNAYYERPAVLALLGDVAGLRVLDAGAAPAPIRSQDWSVPLREFRRVLVHDGQLVISTHHPFMDYQLSGSDNYLATESYEEEWDVAGCDATMRMHFWRRPLTTMVEAFAAADFRIETIQEPLPLPETKEQFPEAYLRLTTRPNFLFFSLRAL